MGLNSAPIRYFNRYTNSLETEAVYGGSLISAIYGHSFGLFLESKLLSRRSLSQAMGMFYSHPLSRKKIPDFIKKYQIPMDEFIAEPFGNFNEFFIRKFKQGRRNFPLIESEMGAFAEGRYLGFANTDDNHRYPVKGARLNLKDLLGTTDLALSFMGGPILISRLCPVDYHRFHFPDSGTVESIAVLNGPLHSVNPAALKAIDGLLFKNERHVSVLRTKNFGLLGFIEVGALGVGRIIQSHQAEAKQDFERGQEKGYFLFGGSTVIVCGQPGMWKISSDVLKNTAKGFETYIKLGDVVGLK